MNWINDESDQLPKNNTQDTINAIDATRAIFLDNQVYWTCVVANCIVNSPFDFNHDQVSMIGRHLQTYSEAIAKLEILKMEMADLDNLNIKTAD